MVRERRQPAVRPYVKLANLLLALTFLGFLSFGCAGTSSETLQKTPNDVKIKCAKCSTSYSIEEGLSETQGSTTGK